MSTTLKYVVSDSNLEIIHHFEPNQKTFEGSYDAAIEFHRNDLFLLSL